MRREPLAPGSWTHQTTERRGGPDRWSAQPTVSAPVAHVPPAVPIERLGVPICRNPTGKGHAIAAGSAVRPEAAPALTVGADAHGPLAVGVAPVLGAASRTRPDVPPRAADAHSAEGRQVDEPVGLDFGDPPVSR